MNGHYDPLDNHHFLTTESSTTVVDVNGDDGLNPIIHHISKFDTLAGVAIKYGVEVADLKKMNGLVTDHQMFALNSLKIPLPGRHPPSNNVESQSQGPNSTFIRRHSDLFDSFQSLKLTASPLRRSSTSSQGRDRTFTGGPFAHPPPSNPPLTHSRKCKSMADGFSDPNQWLDKLLRNRPESEKTTTPEMLLEDNSGGGAFSTLTGKGLALRTKAAANRSGILDPAKSFNAVRKSSSVPCFQGLDNTTTSPFRSSSKWSQDASITKPIFDGRKTKAAID